MDLPKLISFLAKMGVSRNPANLAAAIRFVQRSEGNFDCFGTAKGHCDQGGCTWRSECVDREQATDDVDEHPEPSVEMPRYLRPSRPVSVRQLEGIRT